MRRPAAPPAPGARRHCRAAAQHVPHPAELTHEEGLALVDDLAANHPGAVLIVNGGGPLVRPDTPELASAAADRKLRVALPRTVMPALA